MYPKIKIASRTIGYEENPLVIAEIGINHNGSLETAKHMAKTAIDAGVDIVKHQTHIVDDEMSPEADKDKIDYIGKTIYKLMKDCALNEVEELELMHYVQDLGGIFISTPFSRAAADRLEKFDVPAYKIGSGECNNYPLLEHIADFGKPIILSTGMNSIQSVSKAVEIIESKGISYALLHTTNIYPTPNNLVRLGAMIELNENFPSGLVGLSDHTLGTTASVAAVAQGANLIEKHFTLSRQDKGPDSEFSLEPEDLKKLCILLKILPLFSICLPSISLTLVNSPIVPVVKTTSAL